MLPSVEEPMAIPAGPKATTPTARNKRFSQYFFWLLALAALSAVVATVPYWDRCSDPTSHGVLAVEPLEGGTCRVHEHGSSRTLEAEACGRLKCEPGLKSVAPRLRWDVSLGLLGLYFVGTVVWALRWRELVRLTRTSLDVKAAWTINTEASAAGVLLPGGVGGDALRVASLAQRGISLPKALASVVVERLVGLSTLAIVALGFSVATGLEGFYAARGILAALPLGFVALWTLVRWPGLGDVGLSGHTLVGRFLVPMVEYAREPQGSVVLGRAFLISLVQSALQLVIVRGFLEAFSVSPTAEGWVYLGTAFSFLAGAIPALPGGIGTGDAAMVYFLGRAGIPASTAFAVALLYRMCWYVYAVVGALVFLTRGVRGKGTPKEAPLGKAEATLPE
jgi:uncharacterized membrane protein YbhN (UPF0104 family)